MFNIIFIEGIKFILFEKEYHLARNKIDEFLFK